MKYFLISDNVDTVAGLRMVGIEGVIAHEEKELQAALEKAFQDSEIGLVLVTSKLFSQYSHMLFEYKLHRRQPLIVEMPDRHSRTNPAESMKRYIEEVAGIKL